MYLKLNNNNNYNDKMLLKAQCIDNLLEYLTFMSR